MRKHYAEPRKVNIAVITIPFYDEVGMATLTSFIEVFESLSNEIFIITGDLSQWSNDKIHATRLKTDPKTGE